MSAAPRVAAVRRGIPTRFTLGHPFTSLSPHLVHLLASNRRLHSARHSGWALVSPDGSSPRHRLHSTLRATRVVEPRFGVIRASSAQHTGRNRLARATPQARPSPLPAVILVVARIMVRQGIPNPKTTTTVFTGCRVRNPPDSLGMVARFRMSCGNPHTCG